MPKKGTGTGIRVDKRDGYLRVCRRGPLRNMAAHRAYVNRQMQVTYGRNLRPDEEVHHDCRNRQCWPPTDFHLVVMDAAIHHAIEAGPRPWARHWAKRIASGETETVGGTATGEPGPWAQLIIDKRATAGATDAMGAAKNNLGTSPEKTVDKDSAND